MYYFTVCSHDLLGFVFGGSVHCVGRFCPSLVAGCWGGAVPTAVLIAVPTSPTVVLTLASARGVGSGAVAVVAGTCFGELFGKCVHESEGCDEFSIDR
jgi:hypothetical protein